VLLELDGRGALQRQTYRALRAAILGGRLAAGARLPSTRSLASEAGVARNTVIQAFDQLVAEGYAVTRHGAGTFVAARVPEAPGRRAGRAAGARARVQLSSQGERIRRVAAGRLSWSPPRARLPYDFRYGEPAYADLPYSKWCRLLARRARDATRRDLDYGPPGGAPELREALAGYLARARGVACTPEQVLVVRGSQQAIDLAARLLVDPGDGVAIEEPHYPALRRSFEAVGAEILALPVDGEGLPVAELPEAGARLACVTPSHQFPTGVVMPLARRLELLAWARRADAFVLEDDYDSEFRYDGLPIESLQGLDRDERVLYVGTVSKVLFPALRIGYLVAPEPLAPVFLAAQALSDTGGAGLEQRALAEFIGDGSFERHIRRARSRHAARRRALMAAIGEHLGDAVDVTGANAGLHVVLWVRGAPAARAGELRERAAAAGVGVYSVRPFYRHPPRRAGLLLGYASLDEDAIREGVQRLASVLG
jgi:GntR family transcriptional regulator/MocR family aminotransferase